MVASEQPTSVLPRPETLIEGNDLPSAQACGWVEGQRIGPFKLVRRLGKGGMGQVWLAHQLQPLIRDVALKVMLPERRSARAEAFFEVERQALAQLSHRAIAQIFDAGRLPDGALFFAMEYVPGRPLDEYLRLHPQPMKVLVRMFVELCGGIQHAHQRGLIHRDLKPQNVLVQDTEAGPLPRIIDFGIALGASADGPTPMQPNQVAGTPAYMAPEQRTPGPAGIDARCDIYALGVMLAECLRQQVGLHFDSRAPESTALRHEFARSLGARPSQGSDAAQLKRTPFELRAIVLKSLAEDRDQRYASAASMAEDLQRWLQNEPVLAVAGGRGYAFRCFLRRNSLAAAAASLIGVALLGGTGLALYGLTEARAGRAQAEGARALAEQRRGEAEQLIQFMLGDFADKLRPLGRLDLLDSIGAEALKYLGEADIRSDAASHLARARALRTLGEVQVTRQQFELAVPSLEQAARLLDEALETPGESAEQLHFEAGQVAYWRGHISYRLGDYVAGEAHMSRYLAEARAYDRISNDHAKGQQEIAYALNNLGSLMLRVGRTHEAYAHFQDAAGVRRKLGFSDSDSRILELADTLSWSGNALEKMGRPMESLSEKREALNLLIRHKAAGGDSYRVRQTEANLHINVAELSLALGMQEDAGDHFRLAMEAALRDVATDGTQPRRQLILLRAAYGVARHSQNGDRERRRSAFLIADRAMAEVSGSKLSDIEKRESEALRCLASVDLELEPAGCLSTSAQALLNALGSDQSGAIHNLQLLETVAHPSFTDPELAEQVLAQALLAVGLNSRSLRSQLAMRKIADRLTNKETQIAAIDSRIAELLAPPTL